MKNFLFLYLALLVSFAQSFAYKLVNPPGQEDVSRSHLKMFEEAFEQGIISYFVSAIGKLIFKGT